MFRLEFFSGLDTPGNEENAHGYDGSMSVEGFEPSALPEYVKRMDCVCGPVVVVVTTPEGYRRAYQLNRESDV